VFTLPGFDGDAEDQRAREAHLKRIAKVLSTEIAAFKSKGGELPQNCYVFDEGTECNVASAMPKSCNIVTYHDLLPVELLLDQVVFTYGW